MKNKKKILKHVAAILVLLVFVVLAIGSTESTPSSYGSYSGGGYGSGSGSGYGSGTTTTSLSGTYYLQLPGYDWSITFYSSGSFTFSRPDMGYTYGSYTISGNRLTTVDERYGDQFGGSTDYWTIVNSTTIRDVDGDLWVK